jgi:hypothetical protein
MNIPAITNCARKHVFESAQFYYWALWALVGYAIVREFVQKSAWMFWGEKFLLPREIIGILFFLFACCVLLSAWFLRKKIEKKFYVFLGSILVLFVFNEMRYMLNAENYSIVESLTTSQGYYMAKIIFPFLFFGFWPIIDKDKCYTQKFIQVLEVLFLMNAGLLIFGGLIGVPIMESYPLSGRWGYSGVLMHRVETQLVYGLLLLYTWKPENPFDWKSLIFIFCLLVSGQKAGFLWVGLFLFIVVLRKPLWRFLMFGLGVSFVAVFPFLVKKGVGAFPFWENVYETYGTWGIFFSTRNQTITNIWENTQNTRSWIDWLFGGISRYPLDIEMLPLDLWAFFGVIGLGVTVWFLTSWIASWKWSIPILVACMAGGIFGALLMVLVYGLFVILNKTAHHRLLD